LPAHFLLTTFGSLGDLHPYIAVGRGLRARGHAVTIATSEVYRTKIEGEGLRFHPARPDVGAFLNDPESMRRAFDARTGSEYIVRHFFMKHVAESYEDLLPAAREADLIVGHPVSFATPIVAEKLGKRWISVALAPVAMLSVYDPPVAPGAPDIERFRRLGPWFWRLYWFMGRRVVRAWGEQANRLRAELGLRPVRNPVLDDMFSPYGMQAWFSHVLARPQRDWPRDTVVTGFPFYDRLEPGHGMNPELSRFLASGPPPVVFTLGSSAVFHAGDFYRESIEAARLAGCRAVLLLGRDPRNRLSGTLPETVFVDEYAPYSDLFPRAAATVHQGGVGTTAQALASGRPMIVMPCSHDQPDNAARVTRLGVARTIQRDQYRAERVAAELGVLLGEASYAAKARQTAGEMAKEDGVAAACEGLIRDVG